ncbi:helix-turn-helix domain-containing protein [Caldicellulosiruptor kronotskyensis]|nr:helix-turn-helix domain-containing protein [Caldicellulosiruptor kronotskyensis]
MLKAYKYRIYPTKA